MNNDTLTPEQEIWKSVPGYEKYYEASSLGRIRSLTRYVKGRLGGIMRKNGVIMKPSVGDRGYLQVCLSFNGKGKTWKVHRIVCLSFHGEPEGLEVNHKDGNKLNCKASNLEWMTHRQNRIHALSTGLATMPRGEKNGMSVLTEKEVIAIRTNYGKKTTVETAKIYGVSNSLVHDIWHRRVWKHI